MGYHQRVISIRVIASTLLLLLLTIEALADNRTSREIVKITAKVEIVVPDGFIISNGLNAIDFQKAGIEQALISIFNKPNQLVCQIAATVHNENIRSDNALQKARMDNIDTVTLVSSKEIEYGEEVYYRIKRSDSAEVTAISQSLFFPAELSQFDRSSLYRIFCATESTRFSKNEPVMRSFIDTIRWH